MVTHDTLLLTPPHRIRANGSPRRVGVELEMNGLTLDGLAEVTAEFLDTAVAQVSRYERRLYGDPAGDWVVELDFRLLKEMGRELRAPEDLADSLLQSAEDLLRWMAETVVPLEVVSPPLPLQRLSDVQGLINRLRQAGARGSSDHPVNAFGMQFNPEVPDTEAATLTSYLRAFLCLYDWLLARADIDITRRLTSYVAPFPLEYVRLVSSPDYTPDLPTLIDDYLLHNPTRNRALDMLPLFLHIDPLRVRAVVQDPLVKPRPAFHYRLPDCEIHRPEWGLHLAWNDWVEVERLAADPIRLAACCIEFHDFLHRPPLERWLGDWAEQVENHWLSPP